MRLLPRMSKKEVNKQYNYLLQLRKIRKEDYCPNCYKGVTLKEKEVNTCNWCGAEVIVKSRVTEWIKRIKKWTLALFMVSLLVTNVYAKEIPYSVERIVNAIYKAEGGNKTKHPYGILKKYKHTTPRQACINTVNHAYRDWNGKVDFIIFLGNRYCPIGAENDPLGLNKNWVRLVKYFLRRSND